VKELSVEMSNAIDEFHVNVRNHWDQIQ